MATSFEEFIKNEFKSGQTGKIKIFKNQYKDTDKHFYATALLMSNFEQPISTQNLSELLQVYNNFLVYPNSTFDPFLAKIFEQKNVDSLNRNQLSESLEKLVDQNRFSNDSLLGIVKTRAKAFVKYLGTHQNMTVLFPLAVGFATNQTIPANAEPMDADKFIFMPSGFEPLNEYDPDRYGIKKQNIISAVSVIRPVYFETNNAFSKNNLVAYCLDIQGNVKCILITGIKIDVTDKTTCDAKKGQYVPGLALTKKWDGTNYVNQTDYGVCIS